MESTCIGHFSIHNTTIKEVYIKIVYGMIWGIFVERYLLYYHNYISNIIIMLVLYRSFVLVVVNINHCQRIWWHSETSLNPTAEFIFVQFSSFRRTNNAKNPMVPEMAKEYFKNKRNNSQIFWSRRYVLKEPFSLLWNLQILTLTFVIYAVFTVIIKIFF